MKHCKFCTKKIDDDEKVFHSCRQCAQCVHLCCAHAQMPSLIKGDKLFTYECRDCTFEKIDIFKRMKLNWVQVVHLALYNLMVTGSSGRQGYFHFKEDICKFIETNWCYLMPDREKTCTWSSTVASTLSVHSKLFKSGNQVFKELGWWSLHVIAPPISNPDSYRSFKQSAAAIQTITSQDDPLYGRGKRQRETKEKKGSTADAKALKYEHQRKISEGDILSETNRLSNNCLGKKKDMLDGNGSFFCANNTVGIENNGSTSDHMGLNDNSLFSINDHPFNLDFSPEDIADYAPPLFNEKDEFNDMMGEFKEFNSLQNTRHNLNSNRREGNAPEDIKEEVKEENSFIEEETVRNGVLLTLKEENGILSRINDSSHVLHSDPCVRRLRRKLLLRKLKHRKGMKLFNLQNQLESYALEDASGNCHFKSVNTSEENTVGKVKVKKSNSISSKEFSSNPKQAYHHPALRGVNVLDRFFTFSDVKTSISQGCRSSIYTLLVGNSVEVMSSRLITSPYTSRVLKPYIRRDFQVAPTKLKLLREIRQRYKTNMEDVRVWPIDYCYVQPDHLPAINALCSDFFWPGVDMTEALQYPEFSCVVLYRKLVVGFAFMVPDVNYNEAYISFILVHPDWQRARLGTNMMYHLIQTCMGKDITLHVSPTNPALIFYQKFGFKAEKMLLNFYDKYLPPGSASCPHAFVLRLRR